MHVSRYLGYAFESNVYLIRGGKIALIDTGTGFYINELVKDLRKEVDLEEIDYIILTHEHFDHCGGVKELKEMSNAKIMAHEKASEVLEKGLSWSASFFNAVQPITKVDKKLVDGDIIDLGDIKLHVLYTPGHSKGSICLYEEESKSLFSGDTIFSHGGIGRTDFFGGSSSELAESIRKIKKLPIRNLYPGHGDYIIGEGYRHVEMAEQSLRFL